MNSPTTKTELEQLTSQQFAWHWQDTAIAGKTFPLAVASDPDGMLIDACQRQDAGEQGVIDPFWATTWRAAAGLDQFLDRYHLVGKQVLELGCGTGHAGISAALRGAQVVLTDGVEDPLLLVRLSTWELADSCEIGVLRFGIDKLDDRKFPIILGSDVTYLRELWPVLMQCIDAHLEPGGEAILSDPNRLIGNEFRSWIDRSQWNYEEHQVPLEDQPQHPIRVMRLLRLADEEA